MFALALAALCMMARPSKRRRITAQRVCSSTTANTRAHVCAATSTDMQSSTGGYEFSAAPRSVSTKRVKPQRENGCVASIVLLYTLDRVTIHSMAMAHTSN